MIMKAVFKFLVQHEEKADGGLESLLTIIKYYKGNTSNINLNKAIQNNYPLSSLKSLMETASKCGLISVIYNDIDVNTIITIKEPVIIAIASNNRNNEHFVVCYPYNDENGFFIWDSRYGNYYTSIYGLQLLRTDQKCIVFSN